VETDLVTAVRISDPGALFGPDFIVYLRYHEANRIQCQRRSTQMNSVSYRKDTNMKYIDHSCLNLYMPFGRRYVSNAYLGSVVRHIPCRKHGEDGRALYFNSYTFLCVSRKAICLVGMEAMSFPLI